MIVSGGEESIDYADYGDYYDDAERTDYANDDKS